MLNFYFFTVLDGATVMCYMKSKRVVESHTVCATLSHSKGTHVSPVQHMSRANASMLLPLYLRSVIPLELGITRFCDGLDGLIRDTVFISVLVKPFYTVTVSRQNHF